MCTGWTLFSEMDIQILLWTLLLFNIDVYIIAFICLYYYYGKINNKITQVHLQTCNVNYYNIFFHFIIVWFWVCWHQHFVSNFYLLFIIMTTNCSNKWLIIVGDNVWLPFSCMIMYISKFKWCELDNFYFGRHICYVLRSERFSIYHSVIGN
jgi:hypothetical protein